jgi:hypothetical protein
VSEKGNQPEEEELHAVVGSGSERTIAMHRSAEVTQYSSGRRVWRFGSCFF